MTSKPVYLINKDASYRLDSERKPGENKVCVTMPSLARNTQQWLITDDRLITTLNGSQALTFQAPNQLTLEPPRNNDKSQKWVISKEGVLQCELNKYSLQSEEDYIFDLSLPPDFSDSVVCRTPFSPSTPLENEKWTVEYVDGSGSANDLLEPTKIVDYRSLITKKGDAEPKNYRCFGSRDAGSFDYNPARLARLLKEPRILSINTFGRFGRFPSYMRPYWRNLSDETPAQRQAMLKLLGYTEDDTFSATQVYSSTKYYSAHPTTRQHAENSSINVKKYLTKVTGIWCCIEMDKKQRTAPYYPPTYVVPYPATFCGFTSLKFETNDGSFLLSPSPFLCFDSNSNNMGCPYVKDTTDLSNRTYNSSNVENRVGIGQTVVLPFRTSFTGTLKEKQIVTLEADAGYEIVGFYGRMSQSSGLFRQQKTISQLGIYQRPVSKKVDIERYS
ncbi:MAG: hypothetical protein F6K21_24770 [Symploca sp. SIO2D2]|nr:hypothetical protein [Symploca sp. SIO2D2]